MSNGERLAAIAIQNISGIGPTYAKRLVEEGGNFQAVFDDAVTLAERAQIPPALGARIATGRKAAFDRAEKQLEAAQKAGMTVVSLTEPGYPARLAEIPDPPPALYIYGEVEEADELGIGVVGTRKASPGGLAMAREMGAALASAGVTVVSGLALGVDAEAHRGALDTDGGRTIAVLGTGVNICYPPGNRGVYDRIIASGCGAVLSEYGPGVKPEPHHFPVRNRIISGLSLGVIVIEAPDRSGALITARLAVEQGREVFAVPHSARSGAGAGANRLLKEGAHLVEKVEDILSVIDYQARLIRAQRRPARKHAAVAAAPAPEAAGESTLFDLIHGGIQSLDDIVAKSGRPVPAVLAGLTELEIDGRIRRVAASTFQTVTRKG